MVADRSKKEDGNGVAMPAAVRCAIYTRKSTDEGLKQSFSTLDAQREASEAFINSQRHEGWVPLQQKYDDGGYTGANMDRPALKRLLADVESGVVNCVVFYKVDRLTRSLLDFSRIIEVLDKKGVAFVSVTQQFNTTNSLGRLTLQIFDDATHDGTSGLWPGQTFGGWTMSKGGLTGSLKNLKSFFGFGDEKLVNLGGGRGASGGWIGQYGSFGDKLQALGKSDAAMMGGAMLAFNGLQRGGWTGMSEDVAGGAMIGYKFGGPLGAAVGASIGLEAGIVRMFIKSGTQKAEEKVKALYGVDIRDKGVLNQIVQMAKSGFGGNLDMAIRSPQIRDLIQLYAMTTGQKVSGMPGPVTPLSLVEKGGSLYQSPQYNNGTALSALGGLPSLKSIGNGSTSSASGTVVIPLQIDSTSIGNVAIQDGRVVAQGAITAMKSNAGRRELTALQLSPGTLVS